MSLTGFLEGELIRINGEFRTVSDQLYDPQVIRVRIQKPDGEVLTYLHGTDAQLVRDAVGKYHADIALSMPGMWRYRWESEGGQGACDDRFFVRNSGVV